MNYLTADNDIKIVWDKHLNFGITSFPTLRSIDLPTVTSEKNEDRIATTNAPISYQVVELLDDRASCGCCITEEANLRWRDSEIFFKVRLNSQCVGNSAFQITDLGRGIYVNSKDECMQ